MLNYDKIEIKIIYHRSSKMEGSDAFLHMFHELAKLATDEKVYVSVELRQSLKQLNDQLYDFYSKYRAVQNRRVTPEAIVTSPISEAANAQVAPAAVNIPEARAAPAANIPEVANAQPAPAHDTRTVSGCSCSCAHRD
jgi:hypothetical protein